MSDETPHPPGPAPAAKRSAAILFPILLGAAVVLIYAPALTRGFGSDQIWYFAERGGGRSIVDGLRLTDYQVVRKYWKGDEVLYRPLLFAWLAVQNGINGADHRGWNGLHLALHVGVGWSLFRLLKTIRPSPFAAIFAAWFALHPAAFDLASLHHLGGYVIACWLTLEGLRALLRIRREGGAAPSSVRAAWFAAMSCAALFYEATLLFVVGGAVWVAGAQRGRPARERARTAAFLLLPGLVFGGLWFAHWTRIPRGSWVDRGNLARSPATAVLGGVRDATAVGGRWLAEILFPPALVVTPAVTKKTVVEYSPARDPRGIAALLAYAALLACGVGAISRTPFRANAGLAALLVAAVFGYAFLRCAARNRADVAASGSYLYLPALAVTVALYGTLDWDRLGGFRRGAAAAALLALTAVNGHGTSEAARETRRVNAGMDAYLRALAGFVDGHRGEPDFRFVVVNPPGDPEKGDPTVRLCEGYPDHPTGSKLLRLSEILFPRFADPKSPTWEVEWDEAGFRGRRVEGPGRGNRPKAREIPADGRPNDAASD